MDLPDWASRIPRGGWPPVTPTEQPGPMPTLRTRTRTAQALALAALLLLLTTGCNDGQGVRDEGPAGSRATTTERPPGTEPDGLTIRQRSHV